MTLRTLNYGNYGIFLKMGHAGFCPSTQEPPSSETLPCKTHSSLLEVPADAQVVGVPALSSADGLMQGP